MTPAGGNALFVVLTPLVRFKDDLGSHAKLLLYLAPTPAPAGDGVAAAIRGEWHHRLAPRHWSAQRPSHRTCGSDCPLHRDPAPRSLSPLQICRVAGKYCA